MSEWQRLGLVLPPHGTGLRLTHAMLPTPLVLADRLRLFYASCDATLRGRIFRVDLALEDPRQIIDLAADPVLDLGPSGAFDQDGVNPAHVLRVGNRLLLYYIGWNRISDEIPYTLLTGVAISEDDGLSFHRLSPHPVLPPTDEEAFFRTAPFVFPVPEGLAMLYIGGGTFFDGPAGKRLPTYDLCAATSADGLAWRPRPGGPLLRPDGRRGVIGFGRPVLWHHQGSPSLMLSLRTVDGYTLLRRDPETPEPGWLPMLAGSAGAWEAEMTCFGAPCSAGPWEYLFYNGNQFGRTGFGLARRPATTILTAFSADLFASLRLQPEGGG